MLSQEGEAMTDRSFLCTGATRPQDQLASRGNFADQGAVAIRGLLPRTVKLEAIAS